MANIQFINSIDSAAGEIKLVETLRKYLETGKLLWIIAGGSAIPIETRAMDALDNDATRRLNILLADERYGVTGHKDSNYRQLKDAGFNPKLASFPDILEDQSSPSQAKETYKQYFNKFSSESDIIIAQLGIGEDGHIAGILPSSPAVNAADTVTYYESDPYRRLTLTFNALMLTNIAYVFCFGANKLTALKRLMESNEAISSLPSLILRKITDVTVYNDQL